MNWKNKRRFELVCVLERERERERESMLPTKLVCAANVIKQTKINYVIAIHIRRIDRLFHIGHCINY